MKKIKTSALIGLGALGILFGRKMPGVQVIADEDRIARYSAEPVVCNGEECKFSYVTPAEGRPVDLLLVAVKATVLEQAIQDIAKFIGPDTVILSVLNGITSEEHIDAAYPGHTLWSVAIGMDATRTGRTLVFNQAGKIQFGSAWWFNDHYDGMIAQMKSLANIGVLSRFVGMLTDSRSFLSYTRHDYFRRILCNLIGEWVENGEFPADYDTLEEIVKGICYNNSVNYFGFNLKTC